MRSPCWASTYLPRHLPLAAASAQNVRPQLRTAEAEQSGIRAAGANFSLAKGMPEGQHRSVPSAAGFTAIVSNIDDCDRCHDTVLLSCQTYLWRAKILAGCCRDSSLVAPMWGSVIEEAHAAAGATRGNEQTNHAAEQSDDDDNAHPFPPCLML